MLKDKGIDLNLQNANNDTVLILAAKGGIRANLRLINRLLDLGVNCSLKNLQGDDFLEIAKAQALSDETFLKSIEMNDNNGDTSQHSANTMILIIGLSIALLIVSYLLK